MNGSIELSEEHEGSPFILNNWIDLVNKNLRIKFRQRCCQVAVFIEPKCKEGTCKPSHDTIKDQ